MGMLHVPNETGDLVIEWDADDPESVARAREEWDRLKAAGYAFFASGDPSAPRVANVKWDRPGSGVVRLNVRPVQVREFARRRPRAIAVGAHSGG